MYNNILQTCLHKRTESFMMSQYMIQRETQARLLFIQIDYYTNMVR